MTSKMKNAFILIFLMEQKMSDFPFFLCCMGDYICAQGWNNLESFSKYDDIWLELLQINNA